MNPPTSLHAVPAVPPLEQARDSLFERVGWLYAFLRVRVFRDDTEVIARLLQPVSPPVSRTAAPVLLELGCGPGFYTCHLARRFPHWIVRGVDRSSGQLRRAAAAARRSGLRNCSFEQNDATALDCADASADGVFASRLFTVLEADKLASVLAEAYRVLRPGGRCLLAEPRCRWRAAVALKLLWLLGRVSAGWSWRRQAFREPARPTVLSAEEFRTLVASQPWTEMRCWEDGHYQYALVQKGVAVR